MRPQHEKCPHWTLDEGSARLPASDDIRDNLSAGYECLVKSPTVCCAFLPAVILQTASYKLSQSLVTFENIFHSHNTSNTRRCHGHSLGKSFVVWSSGNVHSGSQSPIIADAFFNCLFSMPPGKRGVKVSALGLKQACSQSPILALIYVENALYLASLAFRR